MVGQNANGSLDADLDETVVDGVHPAAKPGRGACTCLVRSAQAARLRRCRTGPPARVRDASGESLVPFVCETAHTWTLVQSDASGHAYELAKHLDTDSRRRARIARSGPRRENRRPPARQPPQAMSPRHTYKDRSAGTRRAPRGCVLVAPPELAQRGPVLTAPRRLSWLGRSQGPASPRARAAGHHQDAVVGGAAGLIATIWRELVATHLVGRGVARAIDWWFRPTPRATTTTMPSTPAPTAGVGFGIARSGSRRENRRPPARRAPQVVSPRTYRDRSAGTRRATSRLRSCCTARARAKRPRVDGFRAAATGPTTVSEVTQNEYCERHPKMWWSEEQTADPVATIWRKLVVKSLVARGAAKAISHSAEPTRRERAALLPGPARPPRYAHPRHKPGDGHRGHLRSAHRADAHLAAGIRVARGPGPRAHRVATTATVRREQVPAHTT